MSHLLMYSPSWGEADAWARYLMVSALNSMVLRRLGRGVHDFSSAGDLLARVGVKHHQGKEILFGTGYRGAMSYRSFGRLVSASTSLRLVQQPWERVKRDGMPRLTLIVS